MRLCSVSGDLELLSVILPRTSCPPVPFPASSLASPLTHLGGSFTTPPRVVFCPLRKSRLTSRYLTTVSFPTALPFPPPLANLPSTRCSSGRPPPPQGPAPSGVSQVDPVEPVEVAVDSGAARGAEPAGAGPGGAEPGVAESEDAEPRGAEPKSVEPGGAEPGGAESGGAEPGGAELERAESGGPPGVPSWREPPSPQRLCEWYARRCSRAARATGPAAGGASGAGAAGGATGAGAAGAARPGGAGAGGTGAVGGSTGVGAAGGAGAAGPGGARTEGTGAAGAGGAAGVGAQVLGLPPSTGPTPPLLSPPPVQSQSQLQPASPLSGPSPYSGPTRGLTERREPESRPASPESRPASLVSCPELPVRSGRRVPHQRPPPIPGTHSMTLRPCTAPQCVPLPSPLASSLPDGPDPESDSLRAASPTVMRFLSIVVTDPPFESTVASALVAELVDFAAACCLDYATSLVAESESASVCPL
ncbi:unnamed protein product [Closterium sp. NIES-53]